jgi:hypothetical protein
LNIRFGSALRALTVVVVARSGDDANQRSHTVASRQIPHDAIPVTYRSRTDSLRRRTLGALEGAGVVTGAPELAEGLGETRRAVANALQWLASNGHAQLVTPGRYRSVGDGPVAAPAAPRSELRKLVQRASQRMAADQRTSWTALQVAYELDIPMPHGVAVLVKLARRGDVLHIGDGVYRLRRRTR